MKVAVVTPSIGHPALQECLSSVRTQTYSDVVHYVFADGRECEERVRACLGSESSNVKLIVLEDNVGGGGWYGHRVYAACSFLVNADVIVYLDEDNWVEPHHVETLVETIKKGNQWAYSLRKIYDKDGAFVCRDDCESLGRWPNPFLLPRQQVFHIDTSCFAVRRDVAVLVGHAWYGRYGADRQFFAVLKATFPRFECTRAYTTCYRLDGNPDSVKAETFLRGNELQKLVYGNAPFPWTLFAHTGKKSMELGEDCTPRGVTRI